MQIIKEYSDNKALRALTGAANIHFKQIENAMGVAILMKGNMLTLDGSTKAVPLVSDVLDRLYVIAKQNGLVTAVDVDNTLARVTGKEPESESQGGLTLCTKKRHINPRTKNQAAFIDAMNKYEMVFGLGPAGTGKTFLAVAKAVSMMIEGKADKIILTRPAVEAGENLGFLPGDLKEKIDPYLRPLYDALYEMLPSEQVDRKLISGEIEVAPLAYMRGRTLAHAVVILDEAQNTTPMQMKMFLTRLGEGSRMVINGDLSQTDLPRGVTSGLADAVGLCRTIKDIKIIEFTEADVVRHGLVSQIVKAYDERAKKHNA